MGKPSYVNRKPKCVSIDKPICEVFERYSKDTSIPESRIIDKALKEYFENHGIK